MVNWWLVMALQEYKLRDWKAERERDRLLRKSKLTAPREIGGSLVRLVLMAFAVARVVVP